MTGIEAAMIEDVLDGGFVNDGPMTRIFERRIAALAHRTHGVAVTSGTAALALALMACGATPGDAVVVPDLTFIATANAALLADCRVVLADVDPDTLCLTVETIDAAARGNARVRFVVVVEVNGRAPDYEAICQYCLVNRMTLITDSCESLGSEPWGQPLGKWGTASCFSFSPNKVITTGQGGMVVTNNDEVAHRLRQLKNQGISGRGTGGADVHPTVGFNFKFTDIQAAMGIGQLNKYQERIARARERDVWYRQALAGVGGVRFLDAAPGTVHLWAEVMVVDQAKVAAALRNAGVGSREFWFPLHRQSPYASSKLFIGADRASQHGLWLPSSFDLTQDQVGRVADVIKVGV